MNYSNDLIDKYIRFLPASIFRPNIILSLIYIIKNDNCKQVPKKTKLDLEDVDEYSEYFLCSINIKLIISYSMYKKFFQC